MLLYSSLHLYSERARQCPQREITEIFSSFCGVTPKPDCVEISCSFTAVKQRKLLKTETRGSAHAWITQRAIRWTQNSAMSFSTRHWSSSVEFKITGYCDPIRVGINMQVAKTLTYPVTCRFPVFVTFHRRYRQTDGQTDVMLVA